MRKREMTAEMLRELEAVDGTLRGEQVAGEHASLAEFVRTVAALRARPSDRFTMELDARAARRFTSPEEPRRRSAWRTRSARALVPVLGLALVAVAALVISSSLSSSSRPPVHQPRALSAPAGPATARGQATPAPPGFESGAGASGASGPARQIERTSTLDVGVAPDAVDSSARRVFTIVSALGGYVRQSNVSSSSLGGGGATFDIRLPSANVATAIAALSHVGHVRSENDTTTDVTDQLTALERSLGELQAERSSLLRRLANATEANEIAALRSQLHRIDGRIAAQQGALRALRARVDYVSLALSLTPETVSAGSGTGLTPGAAARDAGEVLETGLAVLVIAAAVALPVGALAMLGYAALALARRRIREQALDAS